MEAMGGRERSTISLEGEEGEVEVGGGESAATGFDGDEVVVGGGEGNPGERIRMSPPSTRDLRPSSVNSFLKVVTPGRSPSTSTRGSVA